MTTGHRQYFSDFEHGASKYSLRYVRSSILLCFRNLLIKTLKAHQNELKRSIIFIAFGAEEQGFGVPEEVG